MKTRFAPSPTGKLHIGGARTAMWNRLLANKLGGKFILRFEDSDTRRSSDGFAESIIDSMKWIGINWDEGVGLGNDEEYYQSNKLDRYRSIAEGLISDGKAYPCFCTSNEISRQKAALRSMKLNPIYNRTCRVPMSRKIFSRMQSEPYCIRLIVDNIDIEFKDMIKGLVKFNSKEIEDIIIMRPNGYPTYNFACVIDDRSMSVTHVVRGDEHLSNTPKQILIYNALDVCAPKFGHVPVILNSKTGKKMSKRDDGASINDLKSYGYSSRNVSAYISGLGCSLGKLKKYDIDEYSKKFNIKNINKQPSTHSMKVLDKVRRRLDKIGGNKIGS